MTEIVDKSSSVRQDDEAEHEFSLKHLQRNLLEEFGKSCDQDPVDERMKVYLRIRPFTNRELAQKEDQECLEVESSRIVLAHAPKDSHSFKNCAHGLGKTTNKFTFSKIFKEDVTQKEFFDEAMLGLVKDFVDGQNCLIFTYGVTSSGKTYTVQGEPRDAGILPRTLDVLFNSISGKHWGKANLKPKMFTDVVRLSDTEEDLEIRKKEETLKFSCQEEDDVMSLLGDDASDISQASAATNLTVNSESSYIMSKDSLESELEHRIREETAINVMEQGQIRFSIWVSFAEIYNEQIFDLLQPIPKKKNVRRQVLKLSEDINGSPYIKGLKEICVFNADEAYKLLKIGQRNLQTACTKLNHQSSRSHCIFNIKVIRVVDKGDPSMARVSMLSLCDLAGSERQSKTQSAGNRLKEAGNINTSLMTLGRCIEMLRNKQHSKENPKVIPFRDSKLTRIFQNFFSGQGKANMVVNVNKCASMFDETLHVLKFSAVASQVIIKKPPPKFIVPQVKATKQSARLPSIAWAAPGQEEAMNVQCDTAAAISLPEGDDTDIDTIPEDCRTAVSELMNLVEELENQLKEEKKLRWQDEIRIREEVCSEMMKQLVQVEHDNSERERQIELEAEERMEKRINFLMEGMKSVSRPKKRKLTTDLSDEDNEDMVSHTLYHQERLKVEDRDRIIDELRKENVSLQCNGRMSTNGDVIELNKMLEEAGETFKEKELEIEELKKEVLEKKQAILRLENSLSQSREAMEQAEQTIFQLNEKIAMSECQGDSQKGEVDVLTHKIEQLAEDLKSKDAEIQDWEGMLQREKEESLKQEQALINGYKSEMAALKKQVKIAEDLAFKKEKQLLELNDELDKVKVSKDMLQEDLTNFSDELENANNEKKNLAEQLENMEKEYGSYKSQNREKLAEQLQNVEKEFEEYRSQNKENLAEQLKNVEKEFEDYRSQNKENLAEQLKNVEKECEGYRSLNKELEEQLQQKIMDMEDMTSKCDEHVEKINSLMEEVENLRSKNENQRRDIEDKTVSVNSLAGDVDSLSKRIAEKIETQSNLNYVFEEQKRLCDELQAKLESSESEFSLKQKKLSETISRIQDLEKENGRIQQQYDELLESVSQKVDDNVLEELRKVKVEQQKKMESLKIELSRKEEELLEVTSKIEDIDKESKARLEKLKEEHKAEMEELEMKSRTKIEELHEENKTKIEELQKESKAEIEEVEKKKRTEIEELQKENKAEIEVLNKQNNARIEELQKETKVRIADVEEEYESKIKELKREKKVQVEEHEKRDRLHEAEVDRIEKENEVEVERLEKELKAIIENLEKENSGLRLENNELHQNVKEQKNDSDFEELKKEFREEQQNLEFKLQQKQEELLEILSDVNNLNEKNDAVQQENDDLQKDLKEKSQEIDDLTQEVLKKSQELDEMSERSQKLQSQIEDLKKESSQHAGVSKETDMMVSELNKSQEREAVLKKQLKDASTNIEDLSQRICELEDKLLKSSQASESLRETLKETEKHQRASILPPNERETLQDRLSEYSQTIHDLEKEVQTKDKTIQQERAELQNLRHSIEEERRKYDTILTDAGANEAVLAHLREALAEQEDTMSKQDIVIQQKEAEISSIKHDLEVYMGNYKDLLSERSNASREIRELGIQNASLISDKERIQKQLNEKTVEHEQFTYDKERLQKQLEEKRRELEQTRVDGEISLSSLRQPLMAKVEELETEVKTLTKEKDNLSIVVKDNNKELKELEKCLSESRTECENLKLSQDRYKNEQLVDQNRLLEENVTDLKEKVKTRDQSLRDGKKQLAQLQAEMDACKETLLNKDNEMQTWKNEKDQLVASLEKIISSNKDSSDRIKTLENENISLKSQIQSQAETIQLLAGSIKEEPKTTTRRKTRNMSESSHSSSKSPVAAQENIPVLKPRTQRGRGRKRKSEIQDITVPETPLKTCQEIESDVSLLSDKNVDMSNHVQIDATPPVAARKVRRNKKKRDSIQHSREIKAEKETPQKGNQKDSMSSLRRIGSVITSAIKKSPLASSRSIRKPLEEVTEVTRSPVLEVADSGTQMSAEKATTSKKRRKQHALYNNDTLISDPIDCGAFVPSRESDDAQTIVRRKLRGRKQ